MTAWRRRSHNGLMADAPSYDCTAEPFLHRDWQLSRPLPLRRQRQQRWPTAVWVVENVSERLRPSSVCLSVIDAGNVTNVSARPPPAAMTLHSAAVGSSTAGSSYRVVAAKSSLGRRRRRRRRQQRRRWWRFLLSSSLSELTITVNVSWRRSTVDGRRRCHCRSSANGVGVEGQRVTV